MFDTHYTYNSIDTSPIINAHTFQNDREWNKELRRVEIDLSLLKSGKKAKVRRPSLIWAITRMFWVPYMLQGLLLFIQSVALRVMQPILLGWITSYFNPDQKELTKNQVLLDAGFLAIVNFSLVFITHHTYLCNRRIGMCIRVAICSLIYRKVNRLGHHFQVFWIFLETSRIF